MKPKLLRYLAKICKRNVKESLTFRIFIVAAIIATLITSYGFSTSSEITISTDKESYTAGQAVSVSGTVSPVVEDEQISVVITDPKGNVRVVGQAKPTATGEWSIPNIYVVLDSDPLGTYNITASYLGTSA